MKKSRSKNKSESRRCTVSSQSRQSYGTRVCAHCGAIAYTSSTASPYYCGWCIAHRSDKISG